jgi:quercetin dioxygenase-like cupin family protein
MEKMTLSAAGIIRRQQGKKMNVVGHEATIKLGSGECNGNYVFEVVSPAGMGIPPHVHENEDEFIYVLSGEFEIFLDGKVSIAKSGDWLSFTRGTPHGFTNVGSLPGKTLWFVSPGENFEAFFNELGSLPEGAPDMERLSRLFGDYGLPLLPM